MNGFGAIVNKLGGGNAMEQTKQISEPEWIN